MNTGDLNGHARRLLEAYGSKAQPIAAQKAQSFERAGDEAQARTWRRLEDMIVEMRKTEDVG